MNRPKVADALSYLDQVKARFSSQNAIYTDFLDVMRQFKAQTIGTAVVIRRVRELFEGHPDLIVGFNTFIPQGYHVECPGTTSRPPVASISSTTPTYTAEVTSPAMLPSFSAFRHSDTSLQDTNVLTSIAMSQSHSMEQSAFYTTSVPQTPVQRTNISTTDSSQQNLPHTYHTLTAPSTQPILESHIVYPNVSSQPQIGPSQQQSAYVSNVQQQQHNAQSFNHAIIYVNKVKNRFQAKPDVYKRFLEILQWYQREQDHSDPTHRKQAELQVYQDVAKLLHGHEDLLQEFSRFLPESTGVTSDLQDSIGLPGSQYCSVSELSSAVHTRFTGSGGVMPQETGAPWHRGSSDSPGPSDKKNKRLAPSSTSPAQNYNQIESIPPKKARQSIRDVSISDLGAGLNFSDTVLLQKIRNALDAENPNGNRSYQSLLQNINLFNRKLINEGQLIETAKSSLQRHPELSRQFCDMFSGLQSESHSSEARIRTPDRDSTSLTQDDDNKRYSLSSLMNASDITATTTGANSIHPLTGADMVALVSEVSQKRLDLDFNKLRTCGASYRALPSNFPLPKCSGRSKSAIAREVLNDTYISFSSLTSEDSQFVSSKKNQYEENMYHTEDERYEADMVMEVNRAAQQNLIVVKRRLDQMKREELQNFRLDDYLGGTSAILMKKAVHRVYGDKAIDVIYGLKTCPNTVVPIVIQRMRQKETEWKEAVRNFQQFWAVQDSKNHLRSLDHQGTTFKQRDNALIRPKHVINHVESIARGDDSMSSEPSSWDVVGSMIAKCLITCPSSLGAVSPSVLGSALSRVVEGVGDEGGMHLTLEYPPPKICATLLEDVASLIIHHVKRQSNTSKEDKRTMKFLVRTVVQDLFMQERFPMSDDEDDDDAEEENSDEDDLDDNEEERGSNRHGVNEAEHHESDNDAAKTQCGSEGNATSGRPRRRSRRRPSCSLSVKGGSDNQAGGRSDTRHKASYSDEAEEHPRFPDSASYEEYYCLFYANNQWYAFLRLHHLLLTRLSQLRARAELLEQESIRENGKNFPPVADVLRLRKRGHHDPKEHYRSALQLVKDLLDGCEDVHTYEDRLRDMFGIYAYPWFTMDRLIVNLVRQLQAAASGDDFCHRLTALFRGYFRGSIGAPIRPRNSDSIGVDSELVSGTVMHAPILNSICGPLRTRYGRINEENRYQYNALAACLEAAASSTNSVSNAPVGLINTDDGIRLPNGQSHLATVSNQLPPRSQVPNCYTLVMLRQASKLLIRLLDPEFVINSCIAAANHQVSSYQHESDLSPCRRPHFYYQQQPTPEEEARASRALKRAQDALKDGGESAEVQHWYDYLARYLLIPNCWTAGPVPANLLARVRPVFLYKNIRRCVNKLMAQALERRKQEVITTGDPQPEEIVLQGTVRPSEQTAVSITAPASVQSWKLDDDKKTSSEDLQAETSSASWRLEQETWELMIRVLRTNLTRAEVFRDTYSTDFMQSRKSKQPSGSSSGSGNPKTAYKINWSVGSYGIFVRIKKNRSSGMVPRSNKKFHEFQSHWLSENATLEQMEAVTAQLKREPTSEAPFSEVEVAESREISSTMTEMSDQDQYVVKKEPHELNVISEMSEPLITTNVVVSPPGAACAPSFNDEQRAASPQLDVMETTATHDTEDNKDSPSVV